MASIQFRGINQTIAAFENRGVDAWSLWDGKAFMFKGVGVNDLTTILESLDRGGTTAVYTLKVYEDISDAKKIKSATECDGSFNFRLYDREDENYMPGSGRSWQKTQELEKRFDALEERLIQYFEGNREEEEEEKPTDILGTITGLLQDPDKLEKLIGLGKSLLGQSVQPAYVGQVNRIAQGNSGAPSLSPSQQQQPAAPVKQEYNEEEQAQKLQRLGIAIDTLEKADPAIVDHLEKLAAIAANKPDTFKQLIGMLDLY